MESKYWTGERLETHILNNTTIEHLHRYALADTYSKDKIILDIACGDGYGSNLMAITAKKVIGVDISHTVIEEAKNKYTRRNLSFVQGTTSEIPLPDNSVDIVVSFETIEHHNQHEQMLSEIKRVLRVGGLLIISSPDKKNYSEDVNYSNPYHVKELYFEEFKQLIERSFINHDFYSQKIIQGSLIVLEGVENYFTEYGGNYEELYEIKDLKPVYHFCIASDGVIPRLKNSLFRDDLKQFEQYKDFIVNLYRNSNSYKLGNFLLKPFSFLKRIWSR